MYFEASYSDTQIPEGVNISYVLHGIFASAQHPHVAAKQHTAGDSQIEEPDTLKDVEVAIARAALHPGKRRAIERSSGRQTNSEGGREDTKWEENRG